MEILDESKISKGKLKSLELAEDSRESEWTHPSFAAELFQGRLRWELVHPFPLQSPDDKKIGDAFLAKLETVLKEHIDPEQVDRTGEISEKALMALAGIGAFAMKIPKDYGGLGLSQVNYNRALHLTGTYCSSTAVWLSAHQSIGVPQPLMLFGTPEQKKKYLPQFAKGAISAFALTEPEVGSDPANMKTVAEPTADGQHFIINGEKLWCTNGPRADVMVVMARTPSKMVNGKERKQITAFIVEKNYPGVETAHRCRFMGLNGIQNGLIRFTNVKVPRENILLGEGKGLKLALTTLNTGRLTMPAAVTGGAKWCLYVARTWAKERQQWGHPIGEHEAIASKIASMSATVFAMDAVAHLSAAMADSKKADIRLEAALAKLFCTEACWRIVDGAVQIRGGRGYETSESLKARGEKGHALERMMRDCRINTIIEGTSQIMRLFIAREAMDAHVQKIMSVLGKRVKLGDRFKNAWKAMQYYGVWYPRQYFYKINTPEAAAVSPVLKRHMRFIEKTSHRLGRHLFHAMMIHQERLEGKQQLMTRLVNVGTDLFAMAASCSLAIARMKETPSDSSPAELADLFCRQAKGRIDKQLRHLFVNGDGFAYKIAQNTLAGRYAWLENDILITS